MNFGYSKVHLLPALLVTCGLIVTGCGNKETKTDSLQSAVKLTYTKGNVLVNGESAGVGTGLQVGDRIITGPDSLAMIQFENHSVMALTEKSDIEVSATTPAMPGTGEKPSLSLHQNKGLTFHKVKSGTGYSVRSVTSTAGVRGTMFSFAVGENGKTTVRVLEGKVRVNNAKNRVMLAADKNKLRRVSATADTLTKAKDLTKEDRKVMRLFNRMPIIPAKSLDDLSAASPVNDQLASKMMKALSSKTGKEAEAKKDEDQPKTLAGLKKKYGKLSLITTTTGKQYKGAYSASGTGLIVHTVNGNISLSGSQISKITPLPDN